LGIGDWGLGPIPNPQSPIPMFLKQYKIILFNLLLLSNKILLLKINNIIFNNLSIYLFFILC